VLGRAVRLLAALDLRLQPGNLVAVGLELLEERDNVSQPSVGLIDREISSHCRRFSRTNLTSANRLAPAGIN
jgi:hypothetical protein